MNRRGFLGRLAVGAAAVSAQAVALWPPPVQVEAACADCARLFDGDVVLPEAFAKPAPEIMEMARRSVHAMALRDGISHDEAALIVYWQAFPTYEVRELPTFEAMAADCAAHGCSFSYEHATGPDGRRWAKVTHGGVWKNWHLDFSGGEADILDQIDAECRELHED